MKRWYLSKIREYTEPGLTYWAHALQVNHVGVEYRGGEIAGDPVTGVPTQKALLVLVAGIDHRPFVNDPDLIPLPDFPLSGKVEGIDSAEKVRTRNRIRDELQESDQEVAARWDNPGGYRELLNHYGQRNNPQFNADNFDLTDM